jgi:hypothetical protein
MKDVKACPFCGSAGRMELQYKCEFARCSNRKCFMSFTPVRIEVWNARAALEGAAPPTDLQQRAAAACNMLRTVFDRSSYKPETAIYQVLEILEGGVPTPALWQRTIEREHAIGWLSEMAGSDADGWNEQMRTECRRHVAVVQGMLEEIYSRA